MPRVIRRALLCAALGLITTIAVAWLLASRIADTMVGARIAYRSGTNQAASLTVYRYDRPGTLDLRAEAGSYVSGVNTTPGDTTESLTPRWARPVLVPWGWDAWPSPQGPSYLSRTVIARGWPCRALWCASEAVPNAVGVWPQRVLVGIKVSDTWAGLGPRPVWPGDPPVTLPTRPIWPGFLIDAAVFAAAWWVLLTAPGAIRRGRRRRRGRCIRCAYDLRGLPEDSGCPECGSAAANRSHGEPQSAGARTPT